MGLIYYTVPYLQLSFQRRQQPVESSAVAAAATGFRWGRQRVDAGGLAEKRRYEAVWLVGHLDHPRTETEGEPFGIDQLRGRQCFIVGGWLHVDQGQP